MSNASTPKTTQRLVSIDAYRGAIMISLISVGFGLSAFQGHPLLNFLAVQTDHVEWAGCVYWDLIQPSFMFIVGVAMPFAFAKRMAAGDSQGHLFFHALKRCFNLFLIAQIFTSINSGHPTISLDNVLPQIAFCYLITFWVLNQNYRIQGITAILILLIYTLAWIFYPANGAGGPWVQGYENLGGDFDLWIQGHHNSGYWMSLNAIPSTFTVIAGAMCGKLIGSNRPVKEILSILAVSAFSLIILGWGLSFYIPIIKRILSASFALYSTGWAILFLLIFYWIIDVLNCRRWTFVFVVVGMNSIAAYVVFQLFRGWLNHAILVFTQPVVTALGASGGVLQACLVLGAQWYILYFFYQRRIFFKA